MSFNESCGIATKFPLGISLRSEPSTDLLLHGFRAVLIKIGGLGIAHVLDTSSYFSVSKFHHTLPSRSLARIKLARRAPAELISGGSSAHT